MSYDNWKATNPADETLPNAVQGSRLLLGALTTARRTPNPRDLHDALSDRLDDVCHRPLNLSADGFTSGNRPDLTIWPMVDEDIPPAVVTMQVGALLGKQVRYVDLTPNEARQLALHLIATADLIDIEVNAVSREAVGS